ncbi:glycosyltransferase family 4 protein [Shewanella algae]|uniref:glycosyltransferase family 4 protein n=1 Tax=Shewanella algae TaxID=38313 RepID=UPI001183FD1C|nr:glycosyltransferase family 4 protein [Shewanella algae]
MKKNSVLHVLYTYYPDVTGSTIRSEGILSGQLECGYNPIGVTSPFQKGITSHDVECVGGIKIYRTYRQSSNFEISEKQSSIFTRIRKVLSLFYFSKKIEQIAKENKVTVIHAHSTFFCAFSSYIASRKLKIPFIYEFRSIWEERFENGNLLSRLQVAAIKKLETLALKVADGIVVINEGLKDEVINRGICSSKIVVVPNAVSSHVLEQSYNFVNPVVIKKFGYIGNYSEIEGLDVLIDAFRKSFPIKKYPDKELKFYGRGPFGEKLDKLIELSDDYRIRNYGSFGRDDIAIIYGSVDCIVNPRKKLKICDVVTPLKPLEAMAFRRLFIGSNCKGILEVCGSKENAKIFEADDVESLAMNLREAVTENCNDIVNNGASYARNSRSWVSVSRLYNSIYNSAKKSH